MSFGLDQIFRALNDADVRFVVVGGLAVILHGHLRATRDLDLVIDLEPSNCLRGLDALRGIGLRPRLPVSLADFADPAIRRDWHDNRNMLVLQLWDPDNEERAVDLFVREPVEFEGLYREAAIKTLQGTSVPVASIRHLIQMKRDAARPRDRDDIEALLLIARQTGAAIE